MGVYRSWGLIHIADGLCGSDGVTHPNICSMLQNSGQIEILYSGRCNRTECLGGQVSWLSETLQSLLLCLALYTAKFSSRPCKGGSILICMANESGLARNLKH